MKKFTSVLLAVLVAFSMFSFVVSAADAKLTVAADKTEVKVGDTVKATVSVGADSKIASVTVDFVYDAKVFELVSFTKGTTLFQGDNDMVMTNKNYADGKARFIGVATEEVVKAEGVMFTVELKAIAAADSSALSLEVAEAATQDADLNPVKITLETVAANVKVVAAETEPVEPEQPEDSEQPEEPAECEHKWSTWATTKTPTCKEEGVKTRNCNVCGEEETEALPTVECSKKWVVTKEPTATEYGEKVLKCVWCEKVYDKQTTALKGNDAATPSIPNTDAIA